MIARIAFPSALLSAASLILLIILGGAASPGYSHTSQFISELGATGAPHEMPVRFAGFLPAGVFLFMFAIGAFKVLPRSHLTTLGLAGIAIYAAGYMAAAFFPCDPGCRPAIPSSSQMIHNLVGLAGYTLAPLCLFALGQSARRWPGGTHLAAPAFVAAVVTLAGLLAMSPTSAYVGVVQRAIEASVLLWVIMCAWYVKGLIANAN